MHPFVSKLRSCCFHDTAQQLEKSEIVRMLRCISEELRPDYERQSATLDPCLWLELKADEIELNIPPSPHA
jgi:hypothetical protein